MAKTVSENGISLLKASEGISSAQRSKNVLVKENASDSTKVYPYKDSSGNPTIGYGNRFYFDGTPVKLSDSPITLLQAKKLFSKTLSDFSKNVARLVTSTVTQNQFDALVSFAYNVGITAFQNSQLLKVVNTNPNNNTEIELQFHRWKWETVKGQKVVNEGLLNRRVKEFNHYKKKI